MSFNTAAGFVEEEQVIKKSRFIGWAAPASTREEALAWVEKARFKYPDARHHCWAYLLGNPHLATHAAANDDGEPSGTAGKPLLNVIQHKDIGNVVVVVIRYFGGVKLGAGGLVRAYAGSAEQVLSRLPLHQHEPQARWQIKCDFAHEQPIRHFTSQHGGDILAVHYGTQVALELQLPLQASAEIEALAGALGAQLNEL